MISQVTRLPAVFVRKEAKTYGTCQLAEGAEIDGRRLCIWRTSSRPAGRSSTRLRSCGARRPARPGDLCHRPRIGRSEKLAVEDLELFALYTMSELTAAAAAGA